MRILRLIASADPSHGGPIQGLRTTSAEMEKMGHVNELVTLDNPDADYLAKFPYPVHAVNSRSLGISSNYARWVASNAANYDAAVIHGLWNPASISGWAGLIRSGLPYVVYAHGMMDPWFKTSYPLKHLAKQLYWTLFQGRVLRDAKTVLFTSEEERRLARGVFLGHTYTERVVAYGASAPPPEQPERLREFRSRVPGLGQKRYLLYLSRIHPKKGCDLLVGAFARVAAVHPDVDLVIAGPDHVGLTEELRRLATQAGIGDRIHWPGMIGGDAKWAAYRGAEAFILPSHQENFGIVVAEAMACGTPVLISNKVNIWREVQASGGGLVESDTAEGTFRLLDAFLSLPVDQRAMMAEAARLGYEHHFSAVGAANDLTSVLEAIVGLRARGAGKEVR